VYILAGIAVAVALFALLRPDDDEEDAAATTAPTTETEPVGTTAPATTAPAPLPEPKPRTVVRIEIEEGAPVGGIRRISVEEGRRLTLVVTSDVEEEVHVHGIDISRDVAPGKPARITFTAKPAGRYEIELEHSHLQIADLKVQP
jgi:hypothetical protein